MDVSVTVSLRSQFKVRVGPPVSQFMKVLKSLRCCRMDPVGTAPNTWAVPLLSLGRTAVLPLEKSLMSSDRVAEKVLLGVYCRIPRTAVRS